MISAVDSMDEAMGELNDAMLDMYEGFISSDDGGLVMEELNSDIELDDY